MLTLPESVAAEVRAYLGRARLSGRAAALRLGWTQQYMSRRLTGLTPFDVADLAAIADMLDVPVTAFFEGRREAIIPSLAGGIGVPGIRTRCITTPLALVRRAAA
jgi:transcriptional regulator with XRE-family HTH domain